MNFKKYWYVYIIPLLLLLPVFIFRDFTTSNELRYISIIEEAIRNGSFFVFHNHGVVYADKPPLFFWLMMLCRWIAGGNYLWLLGLLTAIPAGVILYVMNRWCFSIKAGIITFAAPTLSLFTSVMFAGGLIVMRMDMMMTMFIVLSLWSFYKIYTGVARPVESYLLPLYIFLAVFSKGAVGILMPLVVIIAFLALQGQLRTAGRYLGWKMWAVLLTLSAGWFVAVYIEGGSEYLNNLLFKQTVGRGVKSFHHSAPWWWYLKSIWYMAAPWSLFVAVMMFKFFKMNLLNDIKLRFFAVTTIATFVIMSVVSSKIDIYLLPIYPFFIYFAFMMLEKVAVDRWIKASLIVPASVMAAVVFVFPFVSGLLPAVPTNMELIYIGLGVMCVGSVGAIVLIVRGRIGHGAVALAGGMLLCIFVGSFTIPDFNRYLGLREVAAKGQQIAIENNITHYVVYRFRGENMDIYLGNSIDKITDTEQLDSVCLTQRPTVLFLHKSDLRRPEELPQRLQSTPYVQFGDHIIYTLK